MKNALSIDLEDWFCVNNIAHVVDRAEWDNCDLRVNESTGVVLDILDRHEVKATFFVLGWIAEKAPELVRRIESAGHEIATHGYGHVLLTESSPEEFEKDLVKGLSVLRQCGVEKDIVGFRAPSFTVVETTMWAMDILAKHGIKYDSSVFPVGFHPDYGIATAPLGPYAITDQVREFPMSCVDVLGKRLPCSGGGYFRLFPYAYTKWCIRKCNAGGRPAVFYLHPWELDPGQPRMKGLSWSKRFRHYHNLDKTAARLNSLLQDFEFTTLKDVLGL